MSSISKWMITLSELLTEARALAGFLIDNRLVGGRMLFVFTMDKFFATRVKKKQDENVPSPEQSSEKPGEGEIPPKKPPKGVVLGKDGKP